MAVALIGVGRTRSPRPNAGQPLMSQVQGSKLEWGRSGHITVHEIEDEDILGVNMQKKVKLMLICCRVGLAHRKTFYFKSMILLSSQDIVCIQYSRKGSLQSTSSVECSGISSV